MVPWTPASLQTKRHLDQFIRFCRSYARDLKFRGWGWDMRGRMGTGTDLAGWGGDGDDFHPHARL